MNDINESIQYWDQYVVKQHIGSELNILLNFLNKQNYKEISFIDIGGNVGKFYDELCIKFIVKKCIIVEPSFLLYEYMKNKYNSVSEISLYNFGISDQEGNFKFNDSGVYYWSEKKPENNINLGLSKIEKTKGSTKFYKMDTFMFEINDILPSDLTFIKIDTENRDLQIIKDLTKYISHHNISPLILFENNFHNDMTFEEAQNIVDVFCENCNYEHVNLKNNGDQVLYPL